MQQLLGLLKHNLLFPKEIPSWIDGTNLLAGILKGLENTS